MQMKISISKEATATATAICRNRSAFDFFSSQQLLYIMKVDSYTELDIALSGQLIIYAYAQLIIDEAYTSHRRRRRRKM